MLFLALSSCRYDGGDAQQQSTAATAEPPATAAGDEQPSGSTASQPGSTAAHTTDAPGSHLPPAAAPLDVGATVPPFTLANATEVLDSRGALANGPLVLVFYIGDFCPYCRRQLSGLQQRKAEFDAAHATLWGVSADTTTVSQGLKNDLGLTLALGSDPGLDVIRAFGVASEGTQTARPAVFVLVPDGAGARVAWRQVGVGQADRAAIDDILAAVRGGQPANASAASNEQSAPPATQPAATTQPTAAQPSSTQPAATTHHRRRR